MNKKPYHFSSCTVSLKNAFLSLKKCRFTHFLSWSFTQINGQDDKWAYYFCHKLIISTVYFNKNSASQKNHHCSDDYLTYFIFSVWNFAFFSLFSKLFTWSSYTNDRRNEGKERTIIYVKPDKMNDFDQFVKQKLFRMFFKTINFASIISLGFITISK